MMSPDPGSEGNLDFDDKVSVAAVPENFSLGKSSLYASRWHFAAVFFFFFDAPVMFTVWYIHKAT